MKILLHLRPDAGTQIPVWGDVFQLEGRWFRSIGDPATAEEHGYYASYSNGFELEPAALWIDAEELTAEESQAALAELEQREREWLESLDAHQSGWRSIFR